jgi:hypothetical protein
MQIEPSAQSFAARYAAGEAQVVWTTLVADLETPVSAFLKVAGARPSFLLESVEGGAVRGRYSIIGLEPDLIFRVNGKAAEINRTVATDPAAFAPANDAPLAALRSLIAESRIALPAALPPMAAGVFGYLGYDMVRLLEDLPPPSRDLIGIPDAILIRPTVVIVFDAVKDTITIVTPVRAHDGVSAKAALTRATDRLAAIVDALDKPLDKSATEIHTGPLDVTPQSNAPRITSPLAIFFRSCCRSDSRCRLRCRRLRCTARCVASIRRHICISSISAVSPWPDRARKSWSKSRAASSPSGRSPAPARAARRRTKIWRWRPSSSPIPRNAPSI